LKFLLKTTRFLARGDEKWTKNKFLTHNSIRKASLIIKV
jgi:hypothetical protein